MRVVILGAGVIVVTAAWYLAQAGHEVTVIDRQAGPALETSFANAGEISPGYASPWAAPGIPQKAIKWLMMHHAPLIIDAHPDFAKIEWVPNLFLNTGHGTLGWTMAAGSGRVLADMISDRVTDIDTSHQNYARYQRGFAPRTAPVLTRAAA